MRFALIAASLVFASPAFAHDQTEDAGGTAQTPPGLTNVLHDALQSADGLEVIITDISLPPHATLPRHYHPGEEFIYVLEGSATHSQEGQDDIILHAGDAYHIPPRAVHAPFTMDEPMRAVVFRVHVVGQPERVLVEDEASGAAEED